MNKDKALKLALKALEAALSDDKPYIENAKQAIIAIKEALAQPEQERNALPKAMNVIIAAMQADPGYAWSWHCNIAMAYVDEGVNRDVANQGAARFMKLLANVEPAHDILPTQTPDTKLNEQEPLAWESILGAVARGWCYEGNANKTMDSELAVAIAKEVHALYTTPYVATPLPTQPDLGAICQDLQEMTYNQAMRIAELEDKLKLALNALESLFNWKSDPERGQRCAEALTAIKEVLKIKDK